jgi:hypothetical protein
MSTTVILVRTCDEVWTEKKIGLQLEDRKKLDSRKRNNLQLSREWVGHDPNLQTL